MVSLSSRPTSAFSDAQTRSQGIIYQRCYIYGARYLGSQTKTQLSSATLQIILIFVLEGQAKLRANGLASRQRWLPKKTWFKGGKAREGVR